MSDKTWRKRALAVAAGVGVYSRRPRRLHQPRGPTVESGARSRRHPVILAETNEFTSFNARRATGNLDINGKRRVR